MEGEAHETSLCPWPQPLEAHDGQGTLTSGTSVIHQARGRASNRQMNPGMRQYAVELVQSNYADFGPTLAIDAQAWADQISTGSLLPGSIVAVAARIVL